MIPHVSIIIVTHNSATDLDRCLHALPDAAEGLPFDVVVVDTNSTDRTAAVARAGASSPILLETDNRGFAAAANRGAEHAMGEFLLFLNPDALLPKYGLPRLISLFLHERVAASSGLLVNAEGSPEAFGERFPSFWWYLRRRLPDVRAPSPMTHNPLPRQPFSVPFLSGAALLVRREYFWLVGGFHEAYFLYYEDIDLCHRLRERGGVLLLDPAVRIPHQGGRSAPLKERVALSDRAEDVYFSRRRPRWEGVVLRSLRRVFRAVVPSVHPLLIGLPLAAIIGAVVGQWWDVASGITGATLAAALVVLTARVPDVGVFLLLGSLLFGQLVRVSLGTIAELTVTDALLPLVFGGWLLALLRASSRGSRRHPLVPGVIAVLGVLVALLPGLFLAAERLSTSEWMTALAYAGRLALTIALLPLAAQVIRRRSLAATGVLVVGSLLALLGFLQLGIFPSQSPSAVVFATCARFSFLSCPLTGADPHPGRLFSTWLDPNLLGGVFVLAIAVLVGAPRSARPDRKFFLRVAGALLVLA
ncbi:MAG: glycosyltransferase family 2 protein, partial [bacterium]|nr:glycosyltransferase family 2 protein [bacterium]